jgi:small subunit ribosomal protein S8
MSMNDPLGDMLTRIRNAQMRGKSSVRSPSSKLRAWVLDVLADEGYIRGYERVTTPAGHEELEIALKYAGGEPAIRELKRVSTPGRRVYIGCQGHPVGAQRVWAFRSSRRPRVSCRMQQRARPMSAAKCSAACSEEG